MFLTSSDKSLNNIVESIRMMEPNTVTSSATPTNPILTADGLSSVALVLARIYDDNSVVFTASAF